MKERNRIATATIACLAALLCTSAPTLAAELEARVDRERVSSGETLSLTLQLRGANRAGDPDLRPLTEDFEVLDVATSYRTQMVNGRHDASVEWHVTLLPLRTGAIEVPALRVGPLTSEARTIEVVDDPGSLAATPSRGAADPQGPPVFLEAEVDETRPYVQGGVTLTVRLHADDRVLDGALSEPTADDAIVERLGEDKTYRTQVGGRDYAVIERKWSIFPQRSGPLTVSPVRFEGTVREAQPRAARDPFGDPFGRARGLGGRDPFAAFFGNRGFGGAGLGGSLFEEFFGSGGAPVRSQAAGVSLDVQPKPAAAEGKWWVPARDVSLIEQWEQDPPVFRVGEPVNRLVGVRAAGISAAQLPELELPEVAGLKQYSEPAVEETLTTEDEVIAVKARETAIIPTQPGELVLPAVELEWWDTAADEPRTARLPARTIEVIGGSGLAAAPPATPAHGAPTAPPDDPAAIASAPAASSALSSPVALVCLGTAVLALGGALGWSVQRRRARTSPAPSPARAAASGRSQLRDAERRLEAACRAGDPGQALRCLRALGRVRWPETPPMGAADWAERFGSEGLAEAVNTLQRVRYSQQSDGWDGDAFWQAYARARRGRGAPRAERREPLPGLYPGAKPRGAGEQPA